MGSWTQEKRGKGCLVYICVFVYRTSKILIVGMALTAKLVA